MTAGFDFLMDTGATNTLISSSTLEMLGFTYRLDERQNQLIIETENGVSIYKITFNDIRQVMPKAKLADGKIINLRTIKIPSIMIADTEFKNFSLFIHDDIDNKSVDLLGTDILKYFNYSINNTKGIVEFELRKDYIKMLDYDQKHSLMKKSFFINKLADV